MIIDIVCIISGNSVVFLKWLLYCYSIGNFKNVIKYEIVYCKCILVVIVCVFK